MWAHRNRILHQSLKAHQDILEKHVNDQICGIYDWGSQALPRDVIGFLRKPKDQVLQLPLTTKQQWLESVQIAISRKKRHEYGKYISKQQFRMEPKFRHLRRSIPWCSPTDFLAM